MNFPTLNLYMNCSWNKIRKFIISCYFSLALPSLFYSTLGLLVVELLGGFFGFLSALKCIYFQQRTTLTLL